MIELRKAAEMALEALETLDCGDTYKTHNAASALRQALPPVKTYSGGKPNYCTDPEREWVGLTRDELAWLDEALNLGGRFAVIEAIEAKLKEKNT